MPVGVAATGLIVFSSPAQIEIEGKATQKHTKTSTVIVRACTMWAGAEPCRWKSVRA